MSDSNTEQNTEQFISIQGKLRPGGNYKFIQSRDVEWQENTEIPLSNIVDTADNITLSEKIATASLGISILDENKKTELTKSNRMPEEYIQINNAESEDEFKTFDNNSNLDIIFSAIRSLQAEVARLKNSFKYGINSYTETKTALGNVQQEYDDIPANEPLWAVEESDLSEIDDAFCEIGQNHQLKPLGNVVYDSNTSSLHIEEDAMWTDKVNSPKCLMNTTDAKLFLYLTTSNLNVKLDLRKLIYDEDKYEQISLDNEVNKLELDLSRLLVNQTANQKYNILVVISRVVLDKSKPAANVAEMSWLGKNFIWLKIVNHEDLTDIAEGYWIPDDSQNDSLILYDDETLLNNNEDSAYNRYSICNVVFNHTDLYKFNLYSQYQYFTSDVQPNTPSDEKYKYEVAHITIRAVSTYSVLKSILKQLQENELIYCKSENSLYIVNEKGKCKKISSSSADDHTDTKDDGMTKEEIIEWLSANGIVVAEDGNGLVTDMTLGQIKFINEDTGKTFNFICTPDGKLRGTEIPSTTLASRLSAAMSNTQNNYLWENKYDVRGFVSRLLISEQNNSATAGSAVIDKTKDAKLNSDRVKIGAIYAPNAGLSAFGCSHGYIELENTSDKDFQLDGCYLYFSSHDLSEKHSSEQYFIGKTYKLPLKGILPAGGTYLIRAKQYTSPTASNCIINVDEYDQEWYVNKNGKAELLDLTIQNNSANTFLLAYDANISCPGVNDATHYEEVVQNGKYLSSFIDAVSIGASIRNVEAAATISPWTGKTFNATANNFSNSKGDCIYKNTFELDPAKQAFQALHSKDSSRTKNDKGVTDYQYVQLSKNIIEFPKTDETYDIAKYTPKASFQHKNVCTDKTQLDFERPNMPTCSFGIDMHKTRCFNWVSTGKFDEFIWIKPESASEWQYRFESYTGNETDSNDKVPSESPIFSKKHFREQGEQVENIIYKRIVNIFPGCNALYTVHKCIITANGYVDIPTTYKYVVGRKDKNGNPDPAHTSEEMTFTLYPTSYVPQVFQITDQQGFHWIEYQAWAAAALELNKVINAQSAQSHIMPVLINTGDMTQNGTRINEWLDYYNAGKCLFNHLEQMNVVGNNDLCGTDPTVLGTGDDAGKSNSYYFHVFYCYEVNPELFIPIINDKYIPSLYYFDHLNGDESVRFVMVNSELTETNCKTYYGLIHDNHAINAYTGWDIATSTNDNNLEWHNDFTTIYNMLYKTFDDWQTTHANNKTNIIVVCHEMPFTVITNANISNKNLNNVVDKRDRAINKSNSLVGSHLNKISAADSKSNYWFSRLLENFKIKLCIGGHKHTYSCTYPLRELYRYYAYETVLTANIVYPGDNVENPSNPRELHWYTCSNGIYSHATTDTASSGTTYYTRISKFSATDEPMEMHDTLSADEIDFLYNATVDNAKLLSVALTTNDYNSSMPTVNSSKYPVINLKCLNENSDVIPKGTFNKYNKCKENDEFTDTIYYKQKTSYEEVVNRYGTPAGNGYYEKDAENKYVETEDEEYSKNNNNEYNKTYYMQIITYDTVQLSNENIYKLNGDTYTQITKASEFEDGVTYYKKSNGDNPTYTEVTPHSMEYYTLTTTSEPIFDENTSGILIRNDKLLPCYYLDKQDSEYDGVVYFMLQATGYKLKSNKELPTPYQQFSYVVPKTTSDSSGADSPADDQQYPMYSKINITFNESTHAAIFKISLYRITNILTAKFKFSQQDFQTKACETWFLTKNIVENNNDNLTADQKYYGMWKKLPASSTDVFKTI